MDKLSKDMLFYLAMNMELPELLSLCNTSRNINDKICKNDMFWINKINKERPDLISFLNEMNPDRNPYKKLNYKGIYFEVYTSRQNNVFTIADAEYIIKGDFSKYIRYSYIDELEEDYKIGQEVYIANSSIPEIFPLNVFTNKKEAVETIIQEIRYRFEDDDIEIDFDINEKLEEIRKEFMYNGDYSFEFDYFWFSLVTTTII